MTDPPGPLPAAPTMNLLEDQRHGPTSEAFEEPMTTSDKRLRNRVAKAEVWAILASTAQRWADERRNETVANVASWDSDPLMALCATYDLTPRDVVRITEQVASEAETRAIKLGYGEYQR